MHTAKNSGSSSTNFCTVIKKIVQITYDANYADYRPKYTEIPTCEGFTLGRSFCKPTRTKSLNVTVRTQRI